ncbi:hypothetical protein GCM10022419_031110 [Nonomuraea rosea]|uniref:Uncharacterized protein n=1 Tax=Nonomuraea rosea TaxID=638574 RepID=A0ABP6WCM0_9ACTN
MIIGGMGGEVAWAWHVAGSATRPQPASPRGPRERPGSANLDPRTWIREPGSANPDPRARVDLPEAFRRELPPGTSAPCFRPAHPPHASARHARPKPLLGMPAPSLCPACPPQASARHARPKPLPGMPAGATYLKSPTWVRLPDMRLPEPSAGGWSGGAVDEEGRFDGARW